MDKGNDAERCKGDKNIYETFTPTDDTCQYIYVKAELEITNKDKFDRFLTALILSLVVCLANIGLALFGFLLFRTPGDF